MWCLQMLNGTRSFHATEEAANAAAGPTGVVWFDSFDYELHNPGAYARRIAQERADGQAYVTQLFDELRRRLGLDRMEEA